MANNAAVDKDRNMVSAVAAMETSWSTTVLWFVLHCFFLLL